jgi:phosphoribosylglycinamide formyltransferase
LKTWLGKNPGKRREHYDEVLAKAVLAGAVGRSAQAIEEMAASAEADESNKSDLNSEPKPNLVVLAGFMHIVSPEFLRVLECVPCINLHPALPGQFDGIEAIKRAHDAFVQGTLKDNKTGVMVHEVIAEVDRGAPIVVEEVECKTGESLEDLEGRIHVVEHKIIVEAAYKVLHREAK